MTRDIIYLYAAILKLQGTIEYVDERPDGSYVVAARTPWFPNEPRTYYRTVYLKLAPKAR